MIDTNTMGGDKDLLPEADLIRIILLRLPIVSLLRFKSVSKSWCALIQSSYFIHLHTTRANTTLNSSSSNKFGSFILHAAVDCERFRENALLVLSSVSESECVSRSVSLCSGSFGLWSTGFNGICGRCVSGGYKSGTDLKFGTGGLWWRTNDGLCAVCWNPHNFVEDEDDEEDEDEDDDEEEEEEEEDEDEDDDDQQHQQQQQQQLVLKLDNLGFPSCYNFGKIRPIVMVVGSCNGLICLHDSERGDVSLWNPATRQFRILPKSITFDGDCLHHRFFAFGFDAKTKDYKVVLLSGLRLRPRIIDGLSVAPMECICRVQVYSLSTDSWRLLEGINVLPGSPFHYPDSPGLLYLNGSSCFFMAKFLYSSEQGIPPPEDNDRFIISLDLTKEIITPIQLPHHCGSEELYLCYLGDKIALFTARKMYSGTGCWKLFHILVLNEHYNSSRRNNKSWIQLHSFLIKHGLPGEWIIPRGISNDGVFVFLETGIHETGIHGLDKKKMKLYNLVTKEVKKNFIYSDQVLSEAYAYKPSLVSIIGGNGCSSSSYGIE